jgi:hypothetical protein
MLFTLLIATALCGWSYPTIYGDTGLVLSPTADTIPAYNADFAVDYARIDVNGTGEGATTIPVRLNYGVTPSAEIFAFFAEGKNDVAIENFGGGAKINLVHQHDGEKWNPGLALGVRIDRQQGVRNTTISDVYAVSSATLFKFSDPYEEKGYRVRAHAGLEYVNFTGDLENDFVSGFAGLSYESNGGGSAVIEFLPSLEDNGFTFRESTVSGALRFPLSREFSLEMGGTRPFATGDMSFYGGILYHIGPCNEESQLPTVKY